MRVKTGIVRRQHHKKVLEQAKGFWMTRHKRYKVAHEAVMHAGMYAFVGRRLKRRDIRRIWIVRINAALTALNIGYSKFIKQLKDNKVDLNRKMLAEIATNDPATFEKIAHSLK